MKEDTMQDLPNIPVILFAELYREWHDLEAEQRLIKARIAKFYKQAEDAGISREEFKEADKITPDLLLRITRAAERAQAIRPTISGEFSLFGIASATMDEASRHSHSAWLTEQEGISAGRRNDPTDPSQPPEWQRGYTKGKSQYDAGLVKRRGRPRKAT